MTTQKTETNATITASDKALAYASFMSLRTLGRLVDILSKHRTPGEPAAMLVAEWFLACEPGELDFLNTFLMVAGNRNRDDGNDKRRP